MKSKTLLLSIVALFVAHTSSARVFQLQRYSGDCKMNQGLGPVFIQDSQGIHVYGSKALYSRLSSRQRYLGTCTARFRVVGAKLYDVGGQLYISKAPFTKAVAHRQRFAFAGLWRINPEQARFVNLPNGALGLEVL